MAREKTSQEKAQAQRSLVERLWAEGLPAKEVAERVGWGVRASSSYISVYRARGWDLPHRHSQERVRRYTRARWGRERKTDVVA